jgi:hypothetical protein
VGGFALGGHAVGVVAFWRPSEAVPVIDAEKDAAEAACTD